MFAQVLAKLSKCIMTLWYSVERSLVCHVGVGFNVFSGSLFPKSLHTASHCFLGGKIRSWNCKRPTFHDVSFLDICASVYSRVCPNMYSMLTLRSRMVFGGSWCVVRWGWFHVFSLGELLELAWPVIDVPRVWLRIPHVVSRRFLAASFGLFYRLECFSNLRLELSTCDVSLADYTCYRVRSGFGSADGETALGPHSIKILLLFLFISRRFRSTVFLYFFCWIRAGFIDEIFNWRALDSLKMSTRCYSWSQSLEMFLFQEGAGQKRY